MTDPAGIVPQLMTLDDTDPHLRGVQRGSSGRQQIADCWDVYQQLFAINGIADGDVQREAVASLAAVERWAPFLAAEMRGTAEGAGLAEWQISALNARTEILSMSNRARPGECSTVISTRPGAFSMQTWDWHEELSQAWHLQTVRTVQGGFVGLTEYGILGKIGLNQSGVGVHLNVLGHRGDSPGAVPVHIAAAHVLHSASTLDEAVDILLDAPVQTSSAISVVTEAGARIVELSPDGSEVLRPEGDYLLHTNHFLAPALARGEKTELYQPDSTQRLDLMERRCAAEFAPQDPSGLVPYLCSVPGDGAELCCSPDPAADMGNRWATLATVGISPEHRSLQISAGAPTAVAPDSWITMTPATPAAELRGGAAGSGLLEETA